MKVLINEGMVKRNARFGQIASIAGMLVLVGGLVVSWNDPTQVSITWGSLLIGFVLTQLGVYMGNRWGRRPRSDELISQALKGLDRSYTLYNYQSPADHLLVGPAGVWVLLARRQSGTITYDGGRWRQRGGGGSIFGRILGREGFGRPDIELQSDVEAVEKFIGETFDEESAPPVQAAMIFTHPDVQLNVSNAPVPSVHAKKLKEFIRRRAKEKRLAIEKVQELRQLLEV